MQCNGCCGVGFEVAAGGLSMKANDLQEKELLLEQLEAMHRAADEESKQFEDLIRGEWRVWSE